MRLHHIRLGKPDLLFRIRHLLNLCAGRAVINFVTSKCYIHSGNDGAMVVKSGCAIA